MTKIRMGIYDEVPGERHGAVLDPYQRLAPAFGVRQSIGVHAAQVPPS